MNILKESSGFAVLAHPGVYSNFELIDELCTMGLDGIEAYHPRHSPADQKASLDYAGEHRLFITGGSDFHGMFSTRLTPLPHVQLLKILFVNWFSAVRAQVQF